MRTTLVDVGYGLMVGTTAMWVARLAAVAARRVVLGVVAVLGISGRYEATTDVRRDVTDGLIPGMRARCRRCWWRSGVQADHVIPASWGGPGAAWNLRPLCARCNQRRGASLTVTEAIWLAVPGPRDWPAWVIAVVVVVVR